MSQATDMTKQKEAQAQTAAANAAPVDKVQDKDNMPTWVPQGVKDIIHSGNKEVTKWRKASIEATYPFIVNNASNLLGAMHVATEMLMFKSGIPNEKLIKNPSNPINWVWEPAKAISKDIYNRRGGGDYSFVDLFRGNPLKNTHKYIFDTKDASIREVDRQIKANNVLKAEGKEVKAISLGNPWQTRTTLTGLVIWTLSTIIPERKESDEEIERMAKMRTLHPVKYIGQRLTQAVWFPQWGQHKREMLGLGYLMIGLFSGLGAFRNRADLVETVVKDKALIEKVVDAGYKFKVNKNGLELRQGYKFNLAYFGTAVVSFIGGLPLLFALDERQAYSTYGSMVVARVPLLPWSIGSKVWDREDGWQYYLAGKLTFQVEDSLFSLIGGATKKKRPDGTYEIIDHEALKKKAVLEAKEEKEKTKEEKEKLKEAKAEANTSEHNPHHAHAFEQPMVASGNTHSAHESHDGKQPDTKISAVVERAVAMPEHVAAHAQKMQAGVSNT